MITAWIMNGGAVIDAQGRLVLCADCPCSDEPVCFIDCKAAIRERQEACNQSQWTDAQFLTDGVADLTKGKSAVNAFSTQFIPSTWSGGASAPVAYSGSYANSAATWCELYALIIGLDRTLRLAGPTGPGSLCYWTQTYAKEGTAYGPFGTIEQAIADAPTHLYNSVTAGGVVSTWSTWMLSGGYMAVCRMGAGYLRLQNMAAGVSKVVHAYCRFDYLSDTQDWDVPIEIGYVMVEGVTAGAAIAMNTGEIGLRTTPPHYLTPTSSANVGLGFRGYAYGAVLVWSFVHHP